MRHATPGGRRRHTAGSHRQPERWPRRPPGSVCRSSSSAQLSMGRAHRAHECRAEANTSKALGRARRRVGKARELRFGRLHVVRVRVGSQRDAPVGHQRTGAGRERVQAGHRVVPGLEATDAEAPARWRHSINARTSADEACDEASGESARRRGRARRTGILSKKSPELPRTRPDVGVTAARTKNATEPLLDIPALAERLAVSERFVRRLVHERRVPYLKVGHFVRFDPRDIDELLRTSRVDDRRS